MPEPAAVLTARGLAHRVRARPLLEGVSFVLRPGELLGVVGPNGAGKSTLLKLCAGLLRPAAGRVELLGRPLGAWPARERAAKLGYLPQHFAPHWDYSVRELLRLGAERANGSAPPHIAALAEEHALGALLDRRWSSLSGGERGRALAAAVLAPAPAVVLADEPAAALDVGQAAALMALLRGRAAAGAAAAVVAMHDLNLAARWCDRLLVLAGGRVAAEGAADDVVRDGALDGAFGTRFERLEAPGGRVVVVPATGAAEREAARTGG